MTDGIDTLKSEAPIGIIGAMESEVSSLISRLDGHRVESLCGIDFHLGRLFDKPVVVARCGIGNVFAAMCATAMILNYSPRLVINTGVGGALIPELKPLDIVFSDRLCQQDMDTSALGDPVGLISGINRIYFDTDRRALDILVRAAHGEGISHRIGGIATADRFVSDYSEKLKIADTFGAVACEMEGGAIAQVAFVSKTPFIVVRAISDSLMGDASMEYAAFLPRAAEISTALTLSLVREY